MFSETTVEQSRTDLVGFIIETYILAISLHNYSSFLFFFSIIITGLTVSISVYQWINSLKLKLNHEDTEFVIIGEISCVIPSKLSFTESESKKSRCNF